MLPEANRKYTYEDYMNIPEGERIEIIDGEVYNMTPPSRNHQKLSFVLSGKLFNYLQGKTCEAYVAPFAVFLGEESQSLKERHCVEPDLSVICDKKKLIQQGCLGSPDFIIEIVSPSTRSHDYMRKLNLYSMYGVKEYWIVNPLNKTIAVYVSNDGTFEVPEKYTFYDTIESAVLENFFVDFSEILLD